MQMAFYFDQTRCTGCYTCVVACKDWHDVPPGPASWRQVSCIERGKFPDVFAAPACIPACPVGAINKRESDGVVIVDTEKCLGKDDCGMLCREACPYDVPQFEDEDNAKMQMCNFCLDRLAENKAPICVAGCPMRALDAGPLDELEARHGELRRAAGFVYSAEMNPSVVFKPKEPS